MKRSIWTGALFLACALAWSVAEAADRFDVVVINHFLVKAYMDPSTGWGSAGYGFSCGLIVNTGSVPITSDDIWGIRFSYDTTLENPPGPYLFGMGSSDAGLLSSLMPGEAFGQMTLGNDTLRTFLQPGEVLRNTAPSGGALGCGISFPVGYAGTVCYDVTMTLGGQVVRFPVQVDIQQVPYGLTGRETLGVLRVSSSATVSALPTTWGRLKSLYR
jgi:hypothetical protein